MQAKCIARSASLPSGLNQFHYIGENSFHVVWRGCIMGRAAVESSAAIDFKFRSHFTARRAACGRIISRHASQC